ncbi:MAG: PEP-CTERM sorting domain-containing protein [Planctomycetota bacterium]
MGGLISSTLRFWPTTGLKELSRSQIESEPSTLLLLGLGAVMLRKKR